MKTRKEKYIEASITIGGKIFCWHDWTRISGNDFTGYFIGCIKCGANRRSKMCPIELIKN